MDRFSVAGISWRFTLVPGCCDCGEQLQLGRDKNQVLFHCKACNFSTSRGLPFEGLTRALAETITKQFLSD